MSTKYRHTIYGGRIIGAKIRAEGARQAALKATQANAGAMEAQSTVPCEFRFCFGSIIEFC
jgi:hypothetical protein